MAISHQYIQFRVVLAAIVVLLFNTAMFAQSQPSANNTSYVTDTTGKFLPTIAEATNNPPVHVTPIDVKALNSQQNIQATISKPQERKKLMAYLRELDVNDGQSANTAHKTLFYNLANAFARLKLYPLAMKCFFKTLERNANAEVVNEYASRQADSLFTDTANFNPGYLSFTTKDDTLLEARAIMPNPQGQQLHKSPPINYQHILQTFTDGKKAVAYAMLIHVKQPIPGKRKVFLFANSGHTYITLIKYNNDSSYVSLSFGFYPKKGHPFAGTPLFPSAGSTFRDDANYKWDEVAGKFISKRKFEKILALTQKYDGVKYHLSTNNCTDFSLKAALMADISIKGTVGSWPLGHGNNPGITGQSMLNGKVYNNGSNSQDNLFLDHDMAIQMADK
ncbi:hypothetical protein FFF34_018365 [Inquilinus sp. KBS0705]|nr:hypothetical protein FFF34_018365 [Inquilinus sp. KBS0705]